MRTRPSSRGDNGVPLLSFSGVSKRYADGGHLISILRCVSFELRAGASMGLYGECGSGKSTLLRLAAGLDLPDDGSVCFEGFELGLISGAERARLLRGPIALIAQSDWWPCPVEAAVDGVTGASAGLSRHQARHRALGVLECAKTAAVAAREEIVSLSCAQRARVTLARVLASGPRLLLVDEPASIPGLLERDRFCALLRSVARERGIALLVASQDMSLLCGVGVLASVSGGELCSTEEIGTVLKFPHRSVVGTSAGGS